MRCLQAGKDADAPNGNCQRRHRVCTAVAARSDRPTRESGLSSGSRHFRNPDVRAQQGDISALSQQTHETFHKRYYAVVRGWAPEDIEVRHALKPPVDPYLRVQKTEAQDALSYLHRLAESEVPVSSGKFDTTRLSLVLLELATGRRHQLRRHLKHLAHPIIGDATYGKGPLNRVLAEYFGGDRLLLHCGRISFIHPRTQKRLTIDDQPSGLMRQVIERLEWGNYLHASYSRDWHLFDYSDLLVK